MGVKTTLKKSQVNIKHKVISFVLQLTTVAIVLHLPRLLLFVVKGPGLLVQHNADSLVISSVADVDVDRRLVEAFALGLEARPVRGKDFTFVHVAPVFLVVVGGGGV